MKQQTETELGKEVLTNLLDLDGIGQQYISSLVRGMKLAQETVKQQHEKEQHQDTA